MCVVLSCLVWSTERLVTAPGPCVWRQVIFVLVSDIGVVEMEHVMIQYEQREDVPVATLEKVVKAALDAQWKRLNFGKMINQVRHTDSLVHCYCRVVLALPTEHPDV